MATKISIIIITSCLLDIYKESKPFVARLSKQIQLSTDNLFTRFQKRTTKRTGKKRQMLWDLKKQHIRPHVGKLRQKLVCQKLGSEIKNIRIIHTNSIQCNIYMLTMPSVENYFDSGMCTISMLTSYLAILFSVQTNVFFSNPEIFNFHNTRNFYTKNQHLMFQSDEQMHF